MPRHMRERGTPKLKGSSVLALKSCLRDHLRQEIHGTNLISSAILASQVLVSDVGRMLTKICCLQDAHQNLLFAGP